MLLSIFFSDTSVLFSTEMTAFVVDDPGWVFDWLSPLEVLLWEVLEVLAVVSANLYDALKAFFWM